MQQTEKMATGTFTQGNLKNTCQQCTQKSKNFDKFCKNMAFPECLLAALGLPGIVVKFISVGGPGLIGNVGTW